MIRDIKISSPGHDDVSMKILKECQDIIVQFLEFIINISFEDGYLPDHLKIARIIPIFKKRWQFFTP